MTHLSKEIILTDPRGRIISRTVEQVLDGGNGSMQVRRFTAMGRCAACRRLIASADQVAGYCMSCGYGPLCVICEVHCAVCHRRLCGRCRHGFVWGRTPIASCPRCIHSLNRRAIFDAQAIARQAVFQRRLQHRQMLLQEAAMRMRALQGGYVITQPGAHHHGRR